LIKNCVVIGVVGSDEKVAWCKELGFDHVINYKKEDYSKVLTEIAPHGVDVFFDNVS
jgi:NADPH-dependent curcumin reductase CurA